MTTGRIGGTRCPILCIFIAIAKANNLKYAWLLVLCFSFFTVRAQDPALSEYRLKAAFIYNFAKFVEWPPESFADTNSPVVIGIVGGNKFGNELEQTVQNKTINGRPLVIKAVNSPAEATNCHILFISDSGKKQFPEIVANLHNTPVLTIGEADWFIDSGGIINFVREANKIRFQINDRAAKAVGLKISSKLLSLALPASH